MSEEYESEGTVTSVEAAEVLQSVALGVASGAVRLGEAGDGVTVDVPATVELEVEVESGDGETGLEVELEWPDGAGTRQGTTDANDGDAVPERTSGRGDGEDVEEGPPTVGVASEPPSKAEFELFTDRSGEWRWRLVHDNGNVIADGGEGYARKADALNGLRSVKQNASGASVVEQSE